HMLRLSRRVTRHAQAIEHFLARWQDAGDRLWLAAVIGDWLTVHEAAQALGRADLLPLTAPPAEACRGQWVAWLRRLVGAGGLDDHLLWALAEARAEELPRLLHEVLGGESAGVWAALDLVGEDRSWCRLVYEQLTTVGYRWHTDNLA